MNNYLSKRLFFLSILVLLLTACDKKSDTSTTDIEVNAGADKTVVVYETVTISALINQTENIISHEWKEEDTILASTQIFEYTPMTTGEHILTYSATDSEGEVLSDTVTVTATSERATGTSDFDGTWRGNIVQTDGNIHDYSAVMYINKDTEEYTIDYPALACGEQLALTKNEKITLEFKSEVIYGFDNCVNVGNIILSKNNNNEINWKWARNSNYTATGVFKKNTLSRKEISGEWKGTYTCRQGLTGLTLTISNEEVNGLSKTPLLKAEFNFEEVPENKGVPSGQYSMKEKLFDGVRLKLVGTEWVNRPSPYRMVNLDGMLSQDGKEYSGQVMGSGCTTFSLSKTN